MLEQLKKIFFLVILPIGSIFIGLVLCILVYVSLVFSLHPNTSDLLWFPIILIIAFIPFIFLIKKVLSKLKPLHGMIYV